MVSNMNTIFTYLEQYKDISFEEHPFNQVDALVLSQFSYLKWENVIPKISEGKEAISIQEMHDVMQESEVYFYQHFAKDNRQMFEQMLGGKRFGNMKCNYLSETLDDSIEIQFCAFTVFPEGALPVVLFRGTDETILGWKEDYNMTSFIPVSGQVMASLYIKQVALRLAGDFAIAGHSKGGNLAVYSAMTVSEELQSRITDIYDFDGPHFRKELLEQYDIGRIEDRIHKYIPSASVVGILLETEHKYKIVSSYAKNGAFQHSPFRWDVIDGDFVYKKKMEKSSIRLNEGIMHALYSLEPEQVVMVGKILFDILYSSDAETTQDMLREKRKAAFTMLRTMKDIEPQIKEELKEIIKVVTK